MSDAKPLGKSAVPWCDYGWGVVEGCTKVSPGCEHCYAQAMLRRFKKPLMPTLFPERLDQPAHTKRRGVVFVAPMGDLFHEDVPRDFIRSVFRAMEAACQHTFVVLTKRPERMARFVVGRYRHWPHVWLGVSVCTQAEADRHLPILARIAEQGWNTWVSVEPQIEQVDLWQVFRENPGLGGIIVGCESGSGARPFDDDWARLIRDQCAGVGVSFYFKQRPGQQRGSVEHLPRLDGQRHDALPWEVMT